ncbi:MAG: rubredoxin [bacterium]
MESENIKLKNEKEITDKNKFLCDACPYVYDPEKGDPEGGIPPGTPFEDIPDDWLCPICKLDKTYFKKI